MVRSISSGDFIAQLKDPSFNSRVDEVTNGRVKLSNSWFSGWGEHPDAVGAATSTINLVKKELPVTKHAVSAKELKVINKNLKKLQRDFKVSNPVDNAAINVLFADAMAHLTNKKHNLLGTSPNPGLFSRLRSGTVALMRAPFSSWQGKVALGAYVLALYSHPEQSVRSTEVIAKAIWGTASNIFGTVFSAAAKHPSMALSSIAGGLTFTALSYFNVPVVKSKKARAATALLTGAGACVAWKYPAPTHTALKTSFTAFSALAKVTWGCSGTAFSVFSTVASGGLSAAKWTIDQGPLATVPTLFLAAYLCRNPRAILGVISQLANFNLNGAFAETGIPAAYQGAKAAGKKAKVAASYAKDGLLAAGSRFDSAVKKLAGSQLVGQAFGHVEHAFSKMGRVASAA